MAPHPSELFRLHSGTTLQEMGCVFLDEIAESEAHIAQAAFLPSMEVRLSRFAFGLLVRERVELTVHVGGRGGKRESLALDLRRDDVALRLRELAGQEEARMSRIWLDGAELWGNLALPTRRWESNAHCANLRETDRLRVLIRFLIGLAAASVTSEQTLGELRDLEFYLSGAPF